MTDLISRADAIEAVHEYFKDRMGKSKCDYDEELQVYVLGKEERTMLTYNKGINDKLRSLPSADAKPILTEEVREALMRLTMCAREECEMCKYKDECGFDFQYKISTDNMNTLSDALLRSKCEVDAKSAEAVHKPDYSYEADMVRRLKESQSTEAVPQMEHDREWIIGCIEHDGFIKTDRFDKANQIILDALSGEAKTKCVAQIKVDTEEIVRRIKEEYDITDGWILCSERLPSNDECVLVSIDDRIEFGMYEDGVWSIWDCEHWDKWGAKGTIAWMPLPKPYRKDGEA